MSLDSKIPNCPGCGDVMQKMESQFGKKGRFYYRCRRICDYMVGAHPDGTPVGTPATKAGRAARVHAHDAFDRLWKKKHMTRTQAYLWMQGAMKLSRDEAHIGLFTIDQCERLIAAVDAYFAGRV